MVSTTSVNFTKVCATKSEDVKASVDMKVIFAKPSGAKLSEARAPLRVEATMPPSRRRCRNECDSFSRFMRAYESASKEQQLAAGFDVNGGACETRVTDAVSEPQHSTLLLTTVLMGCFGLGLLAGRCK